MGRRELEKAAQEMTWLRILASRAANGHTVCTSDVMGHVIGRLADLDARVGKNDSTGSLKSLIQAMTYQAVIDQQRARRTKSLVKWARGILPWAQPDKRLEQQEEAERLQRQMQETLGDDWYRVMELTMMGYNSVQMGEALGISSSAARTRLMNARMLMEDAEQRYRAERP